MRNMRLVDAKVRMNNERKLCPMCGRNKRFFYRKVDICWACVSLIPEHIPDKQIIKYAKEKRRVNV